VNKVQFCALSLDGSRVFYATITGSVYAVTATTGAALWGPMALGGSKGHLA
jgi:outer membrane protein assembly factor BamB